LKISLERFIQDITLHKWISCLAPDLEEFEILKASNMSPNLYPGVFKGDMGDKGGFDPKL
jgi:hypothetical protein